MAKDPNAVAQKWVNGMTGSQAAWEAGVDSVTVSPGALAARQKAAWLQNLTAAQDKWAANVGALDLNDWKTAMKTKGGPRIAQGAQASQNKFATFMGQLLPAIDRIKGTLPPRGNYAQNKQRMNAFVDGMHGLSFKK